MMATYFILQADWLIIKLWCRWISRIFCYQSQQVNYVTGCGCSKQQHMLEVNVMSTEWMSSTHWLLPLLVSVLNL